MNTEIIASSNLFQVKVNSVVAFNKYLTLTYPRPEEYSKLSQPSMVQNFFQDLM